VEHTIFTCPRWNSLREELSAHLGHPPSPDDLPEVLCGPDFHLLPEDAEERHNVLKIAEESWRLFYKMVENILSLKEEEERTRQAAGGGARVHPRQ